MSSQITLLDYISRKEVTMKGFLFKKISITKLNNNNFVIDSF